MARETKKEKGLRLYKDFLDELARRKDDVFLKQEVSQGYPDIPENTAINTFLSELDQKQKQVLTTMLYQAREGGIHDTLVCLHDRMALNELRIIQDGVEMPYAPFGNQLYYDWIGQVLGYPWPDEEKEKKDDSN